jgi:hypothetical protein
VVERGTSDTTGNKNSRSRHPGRDAIRLLLPPECMGDVNVGRDFTGGNRGNGEENGKR